MKSADDTFGEAPLSSDGKSESLMDSQPMGSSEGSLKGNVDPTEALYSSAGSNFYIIPALLHNEIDNMRHLALWQATTEENPCTQILHPCNLLLVTHVAAGDQGPWSGSLRDISATHAQAKHNNLQTGNR